MNSLFYDSEDHWIIGQNKIFTNKISNQAILNQFHQFEKVLPIDISQPQIVVTCAMISDFLEESKIMLNQSFSLQPNDKIVPFWNMFLNKQEPIINNHHSQLILLMEIESKLTLMANKNIQWWVLFDYSMGVTKLYDHPSKFEKSWTRWERLSGEQKFDLFAGFFDDDPSVSMLLTFAHFKEFFCASELTLDLGVDALNLLQKEIQKLFENQGNHKFIQETNASKFKSRLWSDRVMSDEDEDAPWEDWSNQIDIEDDYGDIYADEA
jgi:hypothetical protein